MIELIQNQQLCYDFVDLLSENELLEMLKENHYPFDSLTFEVNTTDNNLQYLSLWKNIAELSGWILHIKKKIYDNCFICYFFNDLGEFFNKFIYIYGKGKIFCKTEKEPYNGYINIEHEELEIAITKNKLENINGNLYEIDLNQQMFYQPIFFWKNDIIYTKDKLPIKNIYKNFGEWITSRNKSVVESLMHLEKYI